MALYEMVLPIEASDEKKVRAPSIARIRDYWLGGSHHTGVDREFADHILVCAPQLPYLVRGQRAMVRRMVEYLRAHGVDQFLDLGAGLPTLGYVHELAPDARVVYVDIDPDLVRDGRELLAGNANAAYLQGDIRQPDQVLGAPELRRLLDLSRPVAVLLIETLLHIPDCADPAGIVAAFMAATCSGSYLGISHFGEDEELHGGLTLFSRMFGAPPAVTLRDEQQVAEFFAGLELVEPGIVPVPLWRPASGEDVDRNPEQVRVHTGLARKP
jgi:hypothetical protein